MPNPIVTNSHREAACAECEWRSEERGARSQAEQHHAETGHRVSYDRVYACHWWTDKPRLARDGEGRGDDVA